MKLRIYRNGSETPINFSGIDEDALTVKKLILSPQTHWISIDPNTGPVIHIRVSEIAMIEEVPDDGK